MAAPSHGHHTHQHRHAGLQLDLDLEALKVDVSIRPGYKLTWADEFWQRPGSQSPSSKNWIFDIGTSYPGGAPNWGNNEAQYYTDSPENVHITKRNTLAITPRKSKNGTWTSARIETQRKDFAAAPGGKLYIESRIKTGCAESKVSQGIWNAFWALGEDFRGNYTFWPMASEWDFLEVLNGLPTTYNTLHCGVAPGGPCEEFNGLGNGGIPWSKCEFHTVGFEVDRTSNATYQPADWRDEKLRWFHDGVQVHEVAGSRVNDSNAWEAIAHKGHFLLLNVAVGGNWPGQPNATTIGGPKVEMEVDYVRVYNSL
ncbi:concanavalin A-like lectin/glucanase domain-containing protein [Paraphoma chrysanthemicola]|uniref:Concanavalin A-like lectin/glucanase domain-containing protein n=1 Tax=Paraphoma chrysanthemicola TaxID=798071 RepID=A0A8K0QSY7_9PLEO|nr:concanavalin A-like lectin/glucanase domain-containing protein [Paraphoma chrysanthemicola]